eukprot:COSAG06_NODE_607_length_13867_cov_15.123112_10_plen_83_part_00
MDQLKAKQSAVAGYGTGGRAGAGTASGYRPHSAPGSNGAAAMRGGIGSGGAAANAKPWERLAKETAGAAFQDNSADDFDDDF